MDKLTMAHEWAMKKLELTKGCIPLQGLVECAWDYADAMQAEADSRVNKDRPDVLQEEWQPDWSVAPDGFDWFVAWADENGIVGGGFFYTVEPEPSPSKHHLGSCWIGRDCESIETGSFGYIGNWQDSLRKRP